MGMDDVPDIRDLRGRTKRLATAAVIATGVALVIAHFAYGAAAHDIQHGTDHCGAHSKDSAWRFVISMVGAGFAFTLVVVERILARRARIRERLPQASIHRAPPR